LPLPFFRNVLPRRSGEEGPTYSPRYWRRDRGAEAGIRNDQL